MLLANKRYIFSNLQIWSRKVSDFPLKYLLISKKNALGKHLNKNDVSNSVGGGSGNTFYMKIVLKTMPNTVKTLFKPNV